MAGIMQMLMSSAAGIVKSIYLALGTATTPFIYVYPWVTGSGFGSLFSNPATLPGNSVAVTTTADFSPSNADLAVGSPSTPYIQVYPWTSSGFGTKYANPATLPAGTGSNVMVAFSSTGHDVSVGANSTPYIYVYPFTSGSGFGTKYANPATLPASSGNFNTPLFSPSGADLAVGSGATPWIQVYPFVSGTGFGTKYANPATLPGNPVAAFCLPAFSPSGADLALGSASTPWVQVYPWTSGVGFGTKYANPSTLPAGAAGSACSDVAFSSSGTEIAVTSVNSPWVQVYPWVSGTGFGTKYANPATLPSGTPNINYASFSPTGSDLAVSTGSTPWVQVYPLVSGSGFGTKYANPVTLPNTTTSPTNVAFSK
jgi:hypothetical protein